MTRLALATVALGLSACATADSVATTADASTGSSGPDAAVTRPDAAITPDAPPINTCATTVTCTAASPLGTVSGDSDSTALTASGHQAAWYRVRVTEDNSDAPGLALRLAATLTSPTAGAFDVIVYVNQAADTVECSTTTGTVSTSGAVKEVRAQWGEGLIPNGADDSRDVTIEVRPAAGTTCAAGQTWQLQLAGNWI